MKGADPPVAEQVPAVRLLVSPVVPAMSAGGRQVGAAVEPSVNANFTVSDTGVLNCASDPPALPNTLNSAWLQPLAMSVWLSATVALKASPSKVTVALSVPPDVAEAESDRLERSVIGSCPVAITVAGVF